MNRVVAESRPPERRTTAFLVVFDMGGDLKPVSRGVDGYVGVQ
jgi:hypothetical protein